MNSRLRGRDEQLIEELHLHKHVLFYKKVVYEKVVHDCSKVRKFSTGFSRPKKVFGVVVDLFATMILATIRINTFSKRNKKKANRN